MVSLLLPALTGLIAAALTTAQNTTTQSNTTSACVTGDAVHMIIARASLEDPGPGALGRLVPQIKEQLPGSDNVSVEYPATLDNYTTSEAAGVVAMTTLLNEYTSRCPDSKVVMMGYSQGAQVAADVMCGTDEGSLFNTTKAVDTKVQKKVAAVVLMGDPSKAQNQTFINGTSTKDSVFPRRDTSACNDITPRMISYCNAGDTFCDSGNSISVHLSYIKDNGTSAVNFVVAQAKSNAGGSAGGNGQGNGQDNGQGTTQNDGQRQGNSTAAASPASRTQGAWIGVAFAAAVSVGLVGVL